MASDVETLLGILRPLYEQEPFYSKELLAYIKVGTFVVIKDSGTVVLLKQQWHRGVLFGTLMKELETVPCHDSSNVLLAGVK